jgi:hypothetical protein
MGQKSQQALNTLLAIAAAGLLAEWLDKRLASPGSVESVELALTVGLGTVFSSLIELFRQLAVRAGTKYGLDMTKILGGIVPLALLLTACVGAQTPEQRYYVVKNHYASAGDLVNAWCARPSTPLEECKKVDVVMDRAEAEIMSLEGQVGTSPDRHELATGLLLKALEILNRYQPEVKQP